MKKIILVLAAFIAFAAAGSLSAQTVNDVNVKYNEAAELVAAKKFAEAIPSLEATIDMGFEVGGEATNTVTLAQKALPECYFQYALTLARQGKQNDALPQLANAIESGELYGVPATVRKAKSLSAQVYKNLGGVQFNSGNYKAAIPLFEKGYEVDPSYTDNALFIGDSYAEDKNYTEAFKVYDRLIEQGKSNSRYAQAGNTANEKKLYYLTVQANDTAKAGRTAQAYKLFEEIFKLDPNNANAHMVRIQAATNAEDWANVVRWASSAAGAQTNANDKSEVWFLQGAAYQNQAAAAEGEANVNALNERAIQAYSKVTAGNKTALAKDQIEALKTPVKK